MKKRIYIDLDDTIFDYSGHHDHLRGVHTYPQATYGFFTDLEPIPCAVDAVKLLMSKHDVWFATRCSVHNPLSYTEKRVSIEEHFGIEGASRLIITPDKGLLDGENSILIDDNIWEEFKGDFQIHFGASSAEYTHVRSNLKIISCMNWLKVLDYIDELE